MDPSSVEQVEITQKTTFAGMGSVSNKKGEAHYIGEYLVAVGACDEQAVDLARDRQGELRSKGYNVLLGEVLLDTGVIAERDLRRAVSQQNIDRLRQTILFKSLTRDTLFEIIERSRVHVYESGEIIFQQGEEGKAAFVVLEGSISLMHRSEQGRDVEFSLLQPGDIFGEMSLLTGDGRFVTARAVDASKLLIIPKDYFLYLYKEYPQVSRTAFSKWFQIMVEGKLETQLFQDQHYKELLSRKDYLPCLHTIGKSKTANEVRNELSRVAQAGRAVLLVGEAGTGLTRIAQEVHEKGPNCGGPFIIFDPLRLPLFLSQKTEERDESFFQKELVQMDAIFGDSKETGGESDAPWQGFLRIAGNGVIVIKNIKAIEPKVQRLLAEYAGTGRFYPIGASRPAYSEAIIIIIAEDELDLEGPLYERLAGNAVFVPPLRKRKRDLLEILEVLVGELAKAQGKKISGINQEAVNLVMAYNWPGNFKELEEVLQRAVHLSGGEQLVREDIFIGTVPVTGKIAMNLLQFAPVRYFFQSPFYPIAPQIVIACMFVLVVSLGIWGNPSSDSNISLLLVWANWEPLLILSCFLVGRMWCSLCPIGFLSSFIKKIRRPRVKVPAKYMKSGLFISAAGLGVIFWSQAALDMWSRPKETAGLLLAMLSSAMLFAFLFEGKVWCKSFCPLGQMVGTFSRTAVVEVRSNYNYCSNECRTYDCNMGRGKVSGCAMVKGPFALSSNQNCTLCGNCIKTCPNESVRVNLRAPAWEIWNARTADLAALLFVPLLWGTQIFRGLDLTPLPEKLTAMVGSSGMAYFLLLAASSIFSYQVAIFGIAFTENRGEELGGEQASRFVLTLLPLVYANEIAIRLVHLLNHAAEFFVIFGNQIGYEFPRIAFRLDMQSLHILQIFIILVGLAFSGFVLDRLTREQKRLKVFTWLPLLAVTFISIWLL